MQSNERSYPLPFMTVFGAVQDVMELQKGKAIFSDSANGRLDFATLMYGKKQLNRFAVTPQESGCSVRLNIEGGPANESNNLLGMFALLDSILTRYSLVDRQEPVCGKEGSG